jgi:photosystem II oxygen-evolving enhancer protein 2
MKFSIISLATFAAVFLPFSHAFAGMNSPTTSTTTATNTSPKTEISRRQSCTNVATILSGIAALTLHPTTSTAIPVDETPRVVSRLGGLLDRFADTQRGVSLLVPASWNKFEGEVGAYDLKWQDIVDPRENVKISSTPVKSTTTSIVALGENVEEIGQKLAAKRDAKLVKAYEKLTDGILFYVFEFAINDGTHQLLSLSVNKGKIWSLDCNTTEKNWKKREEMYYNIVGSFLPKL